MRRLNEKQIKTRREKHEEIKKDKDFEKFIQLFCLKNCKELSKWHIALWKKIYDKINGKKMDNNHMKSNHSNATTDSVEDNDTYVECFRPLSPLPGESKEGYITRDGQITYIFHSKPVKLVFEGGENFISRGTRFGSMNLFDPFDPISPFEPELYRPQFHLEPVPHDALIRIDPVDLDPLAYTPYDNNRPYGILGMDTNHEHR